MMFSVGAFIMASSLLSKNIYIYTKQESWIPVLLGIAFSMPVVWIYSSLAKRFPSKNLIEINDAAFGRVIGKIISSMYLFWFLSLAFLNTRDLGNFVNGFILTNTPMQLILILFIAVCAWAVRTGAHNFTRYGTIFVIISLITIIINAVLLYDVIDFKNFLPVFTMPLSRYFAGANIVAALPMCEIIAFFMLFPQMKRPKDFGKALFGGAAIGGITLLVVVARDIAVMGKYTLISTLPTFAVLRLIDIGDILTRLEIVYAVVFIALLFFKVTVIFFAAVSCFSRLVNFKSYKPLVLIFGALIEVYAIAVFESAVEHAAWTGGPAAIYSTFFVFILPALTLIVTVIRNISGKEGQTISGKDEKENQAK